MRKQKIKVKKVVNDLSLSVLAGESGLDKYMSEEMLTRPGVELAGFYDFMDADRMVLIGSKEASYLKLLSEDRQRERITKLFEFLPPGFVISRNVEVPEIFIELGNKYGVPVMKSDMRTTPLSSKLYSYLQEHLADRMSVHGVLLDINGMGTLIIGKSGIGKSETALELIKRGHQLISDDRVDVFQKDVGILIGTAPEIIAKFMEIRGIGIVDVVSMFGVSAYRETKKIRLVVELEKWEDGKYYDRLGLSTDKVKYFDTEIAKVVIPILPGRNVATLVESAAMNEKLKYLGYNAAKVFTDKINARAHSKGETEYDD